MGVRVGAREARGSQAGIIGGWGEVLIELTCEPLETVLQGNSSDRHHMKIVSSRCVFSCDYTRTVHEGKISHNTGIYTGLCYL